MVTMQKGTGKSWTVTCICGLREEAVHDEVAAQVLADRHEAVNMRRAYRHDTNVLEVAA